MRNKLTKLIAIGAFVFSVPLWAQDEEIMTVDIDLEFVSNYVFRGADVHENKFVMDGEEIGSTNIAPAFQPGITFNFPSSGWYLAIWGSFAMTDREDQDIDNRFQSEPGGENLVPFADWNATTIAGAYNDWQGAGPDYGAVPGFYKEAVGLGRADELDLELGYEADTNLGSISAGILVYYYPNITSNDAADVELFVGYALPFFPDLGVTVYAETGSSNFYYEIGYDTEFDLGNEMALDFGVWGGYLTQPGNQGWNDVGVGVGYSISGFRLGLNAVSRPDLSLHKDGGLHRTFPAWLVGQNTTHDGLIDNPSKTVGPVNELVNEALATALGPDGATIVSGLNKQDMPRVLYYASVSYSFSF